VFPPDAAVNSRISFLPRGGSTVLAVDAIVNAANNSLSDGGGICGAIHSAAGRSRLCRACERIGDCPTGSAVLKPGFLLPAKFIIHAVGPIGEVPDALESAYRATLRFIDGQAIRSIGLCCLSILPATKIALRVVRQFLNIPENREKVDRIIFVVFMQADVEVYEKLLPVYFPVHPASEEEEPALDEKFGLDGTTDRQ
jgi:O-acetyl-ADP-ribose deacetylase (regulator of RNase III)